MATEPDTRCGKCGGALDARGRCPACEGQVTQRFTPPRGTAPRSPTPPAPAASRGGYAGSVMTAGPELTGRACPYCRFPLKEGAAIESCGSCGAVHHAECWLDNGGCSVTGCVNGPAKTAATQVSPVLGQPPPPPPPQPPSKPEPLTPRRFPAWGVAAAVVLVALLGGGAALAISSSQKHDPSTVTVKERTVEKTVPAVAATTAAHRTSTPSGGSAPSGGSTPTRSSTPSSPTPSATTPEPSPGEREANAVAAVDSYWGDISNHDFSGAYQIEEPSAGSSESEWVAGEEGEGVEHVSYDFEPGSLDGNEATVEASSLRTVARKTGCFTWSGYYDLTDYGGTWKITHDGLERHPC